MYSSGLKYCLTTIVLILIGYTGFSVWQTSHLVQQDNLQLHHQLNQLNTSVQTTLSTLQENTLKSQNYQATIQSAMNNLRHQIQIAQNPVNDISTTWLTLKAHYAIELAQLNAYWGTDRASTIALLQHADHFLSQSHDPKLFPVRQALSADISTLQAAPVIDVIGLLSQLDAIQQLVMSHSFKSTIPATSPPLTQQGLSQATTWRKRLQADLNLLKQFFIVRYRQDPLEPLLTPAFKTMQRETIRISLQEAQWAVLQRNNVIYTFAIQQAVKHIELTFGKESAETADILKQLKPLQAVSIQFDAIIPEQSLRSLDQFMHGATAPTSSRNKS